MTGPRRQGDKFVKVRRREAAGAYRPRRVNKDFASVRNTFNSADVVARDFVVFNANSFRVVTAVHYKRGKLYVRHVFTHAEYDRWSTRLKKGLS